MNDSHYKAAEMHDLAAHAHRSAMEHHGKGDHLSGHELSEKALDHSTKAFEKSQQIHREADESLKP